MRDRVGRPLGTGRGRRSGVAGRGAVAGRPPALARAGSELLVVTTLAPPLRPGLAARLRQFRELARDHPAFEAVARIVCAYDQLVRGEPAAAAVEEVQAALMAGLPPSAATTAGLLALSALVIGERYELAARLLDAALEGARGEGHATRQGIIHALRAASALLQGSLHDAQVEAETGLLLVEQSHFITLLLIAVAITVHIERGALDAAASLARTGEAIGIAEDRSFVADFLTARGRLRIAQGSARRRCRGPAVVRPAAGGARVGVAEQLESIRGSGACHAGGQAAGHKACARAAGGGPAGRRTRGAGDVAA
jgi:hypothetical protein